MALGRVTFPAARRAAPLAMLAVALTYLLVMAPLSKAWFTDDDWHFLALLRHVDAATDAFTEHFMGSYGYRPVAMVLFAATVQAFGIDTVPHYLVNLVLHGAVALLIWRLAIALAAPNTVAIIPAATFLLSPVTQATPLWISNRFDLLATALCLLALLCMHRWLRGATGRMADFAGVVLAMLLAVGCKETALAMIPPLLVLLIAYPAPDRGYRARMLLAATLTGTAVLYWWARSQALGAAAPSWSVADLVGGIRQWCRVAVSLLMHSTHIAGAALVAVSLSLFWSGSKRWREAQGEPRAAGEEGRRAMRVALMVLVAGVVVVQAPVAALALGATTDTAGGGQADLPLVSRRFYYFAVAGALLLLATFRWPAAGATDRLGLWALLLAGAGLGTWAFAARQQSEHWALTTNNALHAYQSLEPEIARRLAAAAAQTPPGAASGACAINLTGASGTDQRVMPTYGLPLDLMVKAHLQKGDSRVDCALITQPPQAMVLTRLQPCTATALPGWRSVHPAMAPLARSGTCTFFALVAAQP